LPKDYRNISLDTIKPSNLLAITSKGFLKISILFLINIFTDFAEKK
jgi:hypothetical protein